MTFVYQHITTNTQLKISLPKLQEQAQHTVQHKTATKVDVLYSTHTQIPLTELGCKEQHFKIPQSLPSTFLQPSTNNAVLNRCNVTIAADHSTILKQTLKPRFIIYFVTEAGFE